ncbi:hypothetical protein F4814DRAFT_428305 [Daldinia grandis]|nr:hypothetical protein F4814DRAFT_428305 [Daldinia grandis]
MGRHWVGVVVLVVCIDTHLLTFYLFTLVPIHTYLPNLPFPHTYHLLSYHMYPYVRVLRYLGTYSLPFIHTGVYSHLFPIP